MTYTDYFLRFANQETALDALCEAFGDDGEGVPLSPVHGALDIIGINYRDDTPEGEEPVAREGYLVNVRMTGALPDNLEAYSIPKPEVPVRVFA